MLGEEAKKYIRKYSDKFGIFPYYELKGRPDEEIIRLIKESLKSGDEIKIKYEKGVLY